MESKTVYVGYEDYRYQGCSEPEVVFLTEEEAKTWVEEDLVFRDYVALEMPNGE